MPTPAPAPALEGPADGPDLWSPTPTPSAPQVAHPRPAPQLEVAEREPEPASAAVLEHLGEPTGYSPALGRTLAPCLLTLAGKGGVGKSSLAYALAQRAAVVAQLRAVLVDGNRGQGDLRTYLALNRAGLPTIYDALTTGDPSAAIITPDRLNANRPHDVEQLSIALVQAPPHGMTDPTVITAGLYHDVITHARTVADLVVVDTQIIEGAERGMVDDLIVPMLASHAFGLGISDLSRPGIDNLLAHLGDFIAQGVPVERLMTMLNRVPSTTPYDLQRTSDALSHRGAFIAAVPADAQIHESMSYGTPIHDNPVLAPVLDQVLYRVTGHRAFAEQIQARAAAARPDTAPRRRLWGRR